VACGLDLACIEGAPHGVLSSGLKESPMKGETRVIELLNGLLTTELTSINQYFLHARMYRNWGLEALNEKSYKKSIKDMKQADDLIERILFLEGLPNLQKLEKIRIGEHTAEMLQCDMALQLEQVTQLKDTIAYCEEARDYVSRDLLEGILEYEEEHVDWIETQQYLIEKTGLENYLQSQL
jgi:bacterioferritin